MATLRDVRRRIFSVKNTQKLTRAMKMVGSAKLRKAERALFQARPYSDKMRSVMASVALRAEVEERPLFKPGGGKVEFIVITGDKGLCGAFNSNVLRFAMSSIEKLKDRQPVLFPVGKKARDFFRRRPELAVRGEHVNFWRTFSFSDARVVAESAVKAYVEESYDATYLVYNEFKTALVQRVVMEQLLPVPTPERPSEDTVVDYLYEPSASVLLDELLAQHVEFQVFRALLESFASEQGARMTAMDAATDNAQEMINSLTLQYHRARQASITRELTEIVSGADALVR